MKVLVTGVTGFIGSHLTANLLAKGFEVIGVSRSPNQSRRVIKQELEKGAIAALIKSERIDSVIHLAGVNPSPDQHLIYSTNILGTLAVFEGALASGRDVRIVSIGSSAEYGACHPNESLTETSPLRPSTAYGISKMATSLMAGQMFRDHGLKVIHVRPFNVIGPGQSTAFFTSRLAQQIAEIEILRKEPVLRLKRLNSYRDFIDVRDLGRALELIVGRGTPGEIYNVCSGKATAIRQVVDNMTKPFKNIEVQIESADSVHVQQDVDFSLGSYEKIKRELGWQPEISLDQSLKEIFEYWKAKVR